MQVSRLIRPIIISFGLLMSQSSIAFESDEWSFEVTPYLLAAGLEGETGIRGVTADMDMSFSDIWDDLDAAFMGIFSAQKGPWTFGLEAVYFKISDQGSKSVAWTSPVGLRPRTVDVNGALDVSTALSVFEGNVGYRVLDDNTTVDVLGGIRHTGIEVEMDVAITGAFTGPLVTRPFLGALSVDGDESWNDAFIGARIIHPVSDNVDLVGYVDVGGGSDSDTYQWIAGVNWEFKEDYIAKAGYRVLDWDYEDKGTVWNMQASGPYLGLGIRF